MSARVLVTGGSGFIGSHVVDALAASGRRPRIFDLRPPVHHDPAAVEHVVGNIRDSGELASAMEGCDAVVHLAAAADVGIVAEEPEDAELTNASGTLAVLEAARAASIGRVVYGSTIWVYGESPNGVLDEGAPLAMPPHLYTATKLAGEMYCVSYAELYGVPYTILRFGIPYGPRSRPAAVIPIFVRKALSGEPLTVAGGGLQTRRFVYVEDLAEGVARALIPEAENRVYNLSSNETVTIRELAETVGDVVGDVDVVDVPGRRGDFGGAEISSARAAQELGWRASTPLRDGVRKYIDWLSADGAADVREAAAPAPAPRQERSRGNALITTIACAVGTLLPWLLAWRTDDFGHGQSLMVAIMTLAAILASISALSIGVARSLRTGLAAGWLLAAYVALGAIPPTRHALSIGMPHPGTLLLMAIGTVTALLIAVAGSRLRSVPEPAPSRVS
jgi:UDP-glucose 4-epimerase